MLLFFGSTLHVQSFMCLLKKDSFCFNEAETDYKGVSDFDEFRFTVETLM